MAGFAPGTGIEHDNRPVPDPGAGPRAGSRPGRGDARGAPVGRVREQVLARLSGVPGLTAAIPSALAMLGLAAQMFLPVARAAQLAAGTHNPFIYFRF
jgi:hypothetical protein